MRWARYGELVLGAWLACSPFVLASPAPAAGWVLDAAVGAAAAVGAVLSLRRPARRTHFVTLAAATGLVLVAILAGSGGAAEPARQSRLLTGLVLMMLAIVPTDAASPPPAWRREPS
ncbi:MAG TPA: hypothetical protein VFZ65_06000 [Planctomycetota bacterium]|nr:hypothetical protein [Planctomycetota bacterium]